MESSLKQLYEFGPFRLDRAERLLLRDGEVVPLTPKAFDVLLALVGQPGRLLEKETLLKTVWPDSFVEENNLADNISRLRKALGEGENGQKFIETIPKRGYRFIASVKELNGESAAPGATRPPVSAEVAAVPLPAGTASPPRARKRPVVILGVVGLLVLALAGVGFYLRFKAEPRAESLAVLPFSADPQTEYLSEGITESLINNLSRLSNLRVTARATAFSYKGSEVNPRQVGQELDVGTVLTGRVTLRDDSLTVQVEMVDAATGTQKWGERYQRRLSDIFAVEEEIGRQVAEKLRLRLSGEEQRQLARRYTDNAEVYQLYLLGLYLYDKKTEGGIRKAVDYFQQAVAKDPNYAPAYTGLANCYVTLSAEQEPAKLLPQAGAAVTRALEIDHNLAEAHAALGWIRWVYGLDRAGAESELEQALKLNPNSADARYRYARVLADTGRFEEAQAQARKAIELDPLSIQYRKGVPYILYLSRRYDEAIAEYRKLIEIAPDFVQTQRELGLAYEQKGMYGEALSQLQKAFEMPENHGPTMTRADIGHLYAVWGRRAEAGQVLEELIRKSEQSYVSAYDVAVIYAGLGETEQAFAWLDKAVEQRPFWLCWLKLDPRLDGLRQDPRFRSLLQRIGQTP
ncbi:MAG TPA: tetratricopeptide repeat protein [Blastocatellia bacterium]|nr:tetratricopeptide repeat protein [Blastocatellia bacterium]